MPVRDPSLKTLVKIGLALFSLIFGAGNIIYPVLVGANAGPQHMIGGVVGFFITAIIIPVLGCVAIILFDGDYEAFFKRLGNIPGQVLIFLCMMILGPLIATPRIVKMSYIVVHSLYPVSQYWFVPIFLCGIGILSFKLDKVLSLLSAVISPILLSSLVLVGIQALWHAQLPPVVPKTAWDVFIRNIHRGYETLDLVAVIFLSSTIILLCNRSMGKAKRKSQYFDLAKAVLKAGLLCMGVLFGAYLLLTFVGLYRSYGFDNHDELQVIKVVFLYHGYSMFFVAITILSACISTAIGYAVTISEYIHETLSKRSISYCAALALFLITCVPLSFFSFDKILSRAQGPIVYIGYPLFIALSICNILYKLYRIEIIKMPVAITTALAAIYYFSPTIKTAFAVVL